MRYLLRSILLAISFILMLSGALHAQEELINQTFENITDLNIGTVSGDCIIEAGTGDEIVVNLVYQYSPTGCFEPELEQNGSQLRLSERFRQARDCNGYSEWTITVPSRINVDVSSASGSISLTGCEGEHSLESASGRIEVEDCQGDFEIDNASGRVEITNSDGEFNIDNASGRVRMQNVSGSFTVDNASGDVVVANARGDFSIDNASGDIDAVDMTIEGRSNFDTASGDVTLMLAQSPGYDLILDSASGDVELNYGGNGVVGFFEFTAQADRGRIISPYQFDNEEEFWRGTTLYERKSFTMGEGEPTIRLRTTSGRAVLELD